MYESLKQLSKLEYLSIEDNDIGQVGAKVISDCFEH